MITSLSFISLHTDLSSPWRPSSPPGSPFRGFRTYIGLLVAFFPFQSRVVRVENFRHLRAQEESRMGANKHSARGADLGVYIRNYSRGQSAIARALHRGCDGWPFLGLRERQASARCAGNIYSGNRRAGSLLPDKILNLTAVCCYSKSL